MRPLIGAIVLSAYREIRTLGSIQANNFFFFVLLLSMQPASMGFLWGLILLLMLIPAIGAPLGKVPAVRLKIWPLPAAAERFIGFFASALKNSSPWWWRPIVGLPPALLLEIRMLLQLLDFWLAFLLAAASTLWRVSAPNAPPEATAVLSMLVVLALSTRAQNLLGLEGPGGRMRYRLSAESGVWILARKGAILMGSSLVLCGALAPLGALAAMLAALAVGHYGSVTRPLDSAPWRFSVGRFFPHGFVQVIALFSCGVATARGEIVFLYIALAAYLCSLLFFGWLWQRAHLDGQWN